MTTTIDRGTHVAERAPGGGEAGYRGDIQGLRAVAVLLVLAYHAGLPFVRGGFVGVDVFFVISGFLITGLIVREIERTGRLSLRRFWARRARRLLPATAVVLGSVGVLTVATLPFTRWPSTTWDMASSALYVVNWRLADQSVDYLVSEDAPSPVQHFWSLAVEEQFYVVWPLLIIVLLWARRRVGGSVRRTLMAGVAVMAVPSLAWSMYLSASEPGKAYFVSTTRLWELAIGAVVALAVMRIARLPRIMAHLMGWAGLAAIVVAALTFDSATPFPSYTALLPTLGAAAVISAGSAYARNGASTMLSVGAMQDVGALSYSLYLWHWPLIVSATAVWGRDDGTLWLPVAVLVVGFSAVPAWLTYRVVEAPIHHARTFARFPWRAAVLGVSCTSIGVASALVVNAAVPKPEFPANAEAPGAAVLGDDPASDPDGDPVDTVDYMIPDVLSAAEDLPRLDGHQCIQSIEATEVDPCTLGDPGSDITVAVVGDSKADQWLPALKTVAEQRGWRVVTYLKDSCPLIRVDLERDGAVYTACRTYNDDRYRAIFADPDIDYVLTSQRHSLAHLGPDASRSERRQVMIDDLEQTWRDLEAAGKQVVVMLDNPSPPHDVMECVAQRPDQLTACAFARPDATEVGGVAAQVPALEATAGVASVDLSDFVCPGGTCPAVIGNVLVYRRGSHLTATYVESLAPRLDEALQRAMSSG